MNTNIKTYKDLRVWQHSHGIVLDIYKLSASFPQQELFSLTNQMRRAAVSITSNLAEGFGIKSGKNKVRYYYIAHGSLLELDNQITIAKDLGYVSKKQADSIFADINLAQRMLQKLITAINKA